MLEISANASEFFAKLSSAEVLDCTIRDGGYANNWDFSIDFAQELIDSNHAAGIRLMELGLRSPDNQGLKGPFAHTPDSLLAHLRFHSDTKYFVMCNVSDFQKFDRSELEIELDGLFRSKYSDSAVSGVRVATTFANLNLAGQIAAILKRKSLMVAVNLMHASTLSIEDFKTFGSAFSQDDVWALYLADSFGSMVPLQVRNAFTALASSWPGPMGFHAHDNLGLAIANTVDAISAGATYIDATLSGVGRGGGNLNLQEVLLHKYLNSTDYSGNIHKIQNLAVKFEQGFQIQNANFSSLLLASGRLNVHPNYTAEIGEFPDVTIAEGVKALARIASFGSSAFDKAKLQESIEVYTEKAKGSGVPRVTHDKVLLLGPGWLSDAVVEQIRWLANQKSFEIIALNDSHPELNGVVKYRFTVNPVKLSSLSEKLSDYQGDIVCPVNQVKDGFVIDPKYDEKHIVDLGFQVQDSEMHLDGCVAFGPSPIALSYALAYLSSLNLSKLIFAGFIGYDSLDYRQSDTADAIRLFKTKSSAQVVALSKNNYGIPTISAFGII